MDPGSVVVVVVSALVLTVLLVWYFFGPKKSRQAQLEDGVQVVRVSVKGGYTPDLVQVQAEVPVRMLFDRQEAGECSSRVVMPDFRVNTLLPAYATTAVEFVPRQEGEYRFACGMNMISGVVRVAAGAGRGSEASGSGAGPSLATLDRNANGHAPPAAGADSIVGPGGQPGGEGARDAEAAERRRGDRRPDPPGARRCGADRAGAVRGDGPPSCSAVTWVPELLLNHWVQLVLITPVMFYTGWPIHRTGWLALSHRSAEMNSLITLGTVAAYGYSLLVTVAPAVLPADVRDVYFEAVGVIITLILLGRLLETRAKAGTGEAIRALLGLQARTARVVRDGVESRDARRAGQRSVTRSWSGPGRSCRSTGRSSVGQLRRGRVDGHR